MCVALGRTFIEHEAESTDAFRDHPYRPIDDGIARIALARERGIVAGRPAWAPSAFHRDQTGRARSLGFGRREEFFQTIEHEKSPLKAGLRERYCQVLPCEGRVRRAAHHLVAT